MRVFLQKIIWSAWHSLRTGWWAYQMLIALVGGKMGKAAKRIYRFWGSQVHDIIRWRQVHDIITSYNQIYLVGPVKEIKSGKYITLQGLVSGMELFLYSTALRCGSFSEKNVKKKHLCHHDKNYYYFWKSNIPVINLTEDSRNMIKVSKNMNL